MILVRKGLRVRKKISIVDPDPIGSASLSRIPGRHLGPADPDSYPFQSNIKPYYTRRWVAKLVIDGWLSWFGDWVAKLLEMGG
jgi:hypothetical protein